MSISKVYKFYRKQLYPKLDGIRGKFWLNRMLCKLLEIDLEQPVGEPNLLSELGWENLIILDACRYDIYNEQFDSSIDYAISPSSHSREFVKENFSTHNFQDTVYVTGNPHFSSDWFSNITGRELDEVFYEVFKTFETDWDDDLGTTPPEKIFRDAKTAKKLFPDKKVIVHFMQPHGPLISSNKSVEDLEQLSGDEKHSKMIKAYENNLNEVLPWVKKLSSVLDGEIIVTADHGELLGEGGLYFSHPYGVNVEALRKVPWHKIS